jgi:hypothetical protein
LLGVGPGEGETESRGGVGMSRLGSSPRNALVERDEPSNGRKF